MLISLLSTQSRHLECPQNSNISMVQHSSTLKVGRLLASPPCLRRRNRCFWEILHNFRCIMPLYWQPIFHSLSFTLVKAPAISIFSSDRTQIHDFKDFLWFMIFCNLCNFNQLVPSGKQVFSPKIPKFKIWLGRVKMCVCVCRHAVPGIRLVHS